MREIKFRGKDEWGNWRYGDLMKNFIPTASPVIVEDFYYDDPDDSMFEVNPDTVGQFTGLKDKDGREIYEGDILQNKHARYILKYDKGEFVAVEITTRAVPDKTGWHWEDIEKSVQPLKDVLDNLIDDYKIIVVGNIHDNIIVRDGAR